ncbi:GGDEF domain-containing protein [Sphingobium tyrosinilyticum]|uniref:diguanylate cyclase n=1 Tax=Sphingobium tyrosinilyticum TaxID=2715436 RepID=A0ABV9EY14_9SPHN
MAITFEQARKSLAFLDHHQLEPSAIYYEMALAYITGDLPDLVKDIETRTDGGVRLAWSEADKIVQDFLGKNRAMLDKREKEVAQQTRQLGDLTSEVHEVTSGLERDVANTVSEATGWPEASSEFLSRLAYAERELAELRSNVTKLQARLDSKADGEPDQGRDALTQALNRDGAHDVLRNLTCDGRSYIIIMFGLDNLSDLNAKHDRSVGDNILSALASTLRHFFQEQELIRWAGNQFVVVLRETPLMHARVIAEEALVAMSQRRLRLRGTGEWIGVVTASAGIVVGHREITTDVLDLARANLMSASEAGGNRVKG